MKRMATSGLFQADGGQARRLAEVHSEPACETDAELARALKEKKADAAARVYDRHAAAVHRVAYRLLGGDAELGDIVQEVFIYAFNSIDKLREPAALKSWLLGITVGKVRSHLRLRYRRRWLSFLPHDQVPEPTAETPDADSDLVRQVRSILEDLPTEERVALVLYRAEGLTLNDAAKASGMSLSTFKRRLARGEERFIARAKGRPALARILGGSPQ